MKSCKEKKALKFILINQLSQNFACHDIGKIVTWLDWYLYTAIIIYTMQGARTSAAMVLT